MDEAAVHGRADGPPPMNRELRDGLTAALEGWEAEGALRENALGLVEWLAVDLAGYLCLHLGSREKAQAWLCDFGDDVCRVQQHPHPAGPTAIEILSVAIEEADAARERFLRIGRPFLLYLRAGREVPDAREMALTFALWAGGWLAALMHHEAERIAAYTNSREHARPATDLLAESGAQAERDEAGS